MSERIRESASRRAVMLGISLAGVAGVVVGYFFGPWVGHKTAALTVTGSELTWFAKSFPAMVDRAWLAAPPVSAAVLLGLVAQRLSRGLPLRLGMVGLGLLILLISLPVYDSVLSPEYRDQLVIAAVGAVLVLLTLLTRRLSGRAWGVLVVLMALLGPAPALWQFARLYPLVAELYGTPAAVGWGLILCVVGFLLLLARGVIAAAGLHRPSGPFEQVTAPGC